jgi:hypothetical protein
VWFALCFLGITVSHVSLSATDYDEETKMTIETSPDVSVVPTFDAMGLKEDLLRGIYSYGPWCW